MGRRWWTGLSIINMTGGGPSRPNQIFIWWAEARPHPIKFSEHEPWSGPAHHFFGEWAAARPSPSHSQKITARPDPAHDIGSEPDRPAISVGRPVDLAGRPMDRPMCCSVLLKRCTHKAWRAFLYFLFGFRLAFRSGLLGPADPGT